MSRGKILELLRPDPNTGKVYTLLTYEVFGVVRSLMPFRLTGGSKGEGRYGGSGSVNCDVYFFIIKQCYLTEIFCWQCICDYVGYS